MPNKSTGFYTTDMPMKSIWSNNIKSIGEYSPDSLSLVIEFNSGAVYKYYGIQPDMYAGMMKAPSHGVFFYHNIRQKFPYDLLTGIPQVKKPVDNVLLEVYPELAKLNKLDEKESKLRKQFNSNSLDFTEFDKALRTIDNERNILCIKLEKKGYFEPEPVVQPVVKFNYWALGWDIMVGTCKGINLVIKGCLILMGVLVGLIAAMS
jgi:hypothetical protein